MAQHPAHHWTLLSGLLPGEDLRLALHPVAEPGRIATVGALPGAEVFLVDFAGHTGVDFAYEDADQRELLEQSIDLAAAATTGPTRVTVDRAGDLTIASSMIVDPEGPYPRKILGSSRPLRRLRARLRGRRVTRSVVDFPRVP